jgi:hypothetical protein
MGAPAASRCLVGALLCAGMVLAAVSLEVVGEQHANSPHPAWAERVVPLAWPASARVLWWMGIAAAAGGYRILLSRAGFPQRRAVTVMFVVPFLLFAAGIARGAPWATWH